MTPEDRDEFPDEAGQDGSASADEGVSRSSGVADEDPEQANSQGSARARKSKRKRRQLPIWQESILLVAVALVLAMVIKAFFLQAFYIPSQSMEPGLVVNDRIVVQKVSYWGDGEPQRGDVIVFQDPGGWLGPDDTEGPSNPITKGLAAVGLYPTGGHLVKRVIAVGGDHVVCCDKRGRLSINGHPMDERGYVKQDGTECAVPNRRCKLDVTIPEDYLLMMGDNRGNSQDSTAHMCDHPKREQCPPTRGLVSTDLVEGKVMALVWPTDRFSWLERPEVFEDVPGSP